LQVPPRACRARVTGWQFIEQFWFNAAFHVSERGNGVPACCCSERLQTSLHLEQGAVATKPRAKR
jgi:hypothetical protein